MFQIDRLIGDFVDSWGSGLAFAAVAIVGFALFKLSIGPSD